MPGVRASAPAAPRKGGLSLASRAFRAAARPAQGLPLLGLEPAPEAPRAGTACDAPVPCAAAGPACLCCGAPLTWLQLSAWQQQLPLCRGGLYALCAACRGLNVKALQP